MNPQAILLNGAGLLNAVETEVVLFLSRNARCKFSSNQIFNGMPVWLKNQIQAIAHLYAKGGCSSPASYVGTVAAMMAKNRVGISHDHHHYCPILQRFDDAFEKV
ncbi:MAG: hypothetical protein AAGU75_19125 [Bacillota bacterium]